MRTISFISVFFTLTVMQPREEVLFLVVVENVSNIVSFSFRFYPESRQAKMGRFFHDQVLLFVPDIVNMWGPSWRPNIKLFV